ncbi:MAG: hypothetical protein ACFE89_10535 [Candidatus Hodarchaeota archaeon]
MERNKIHIAILVSTYALIIIALYLSPNTPFPTHTFTQPNSNPQNSPESVSKCRSPPTKCDLTKSFFWDVPAEWPAGVYPLCEEWITVYYWNCTELEGRYIEIYSLQTDKNGQILIPHMIPGKYKFEWVGDTSCPCCHEYWEHEITCCVPHSGYAFPDNFVHKVNGGDKALLFFDLESDLVISYPPLDGVTAQ